MPPQLTETWGSAYLQIVIVFLLFALGVPAVLFQIAIPEDIRRIVHRQFKKGWFYSASIALTLISLSFVWLFHPSGTGSPPIPDWKSYTSNIIVTIVFVSILIFWWKNLGSYTREKIVDRLKSEIINILVNQGVLNEKILEDLVYLGEQGNPGDEKNLELEALDDLAKIMQEEECYRGSELGDLINGFETILTGNTKPGSDRNFRAACAILKGIWDRANDKGMGSLPDARQSANALGCLGTEAIEKKFETAAFEFLEAVSTNKDILFEMGLEALRAKKFYMARVALHKLEALPGHESPFSLETSNYFLGLLAHFWDLNGSARLHAHMRISRNRAKFLPALADHLQNAIDYHNAMANYETVDALECMSAYIAADTPSSPPTPLFPR